MQLWSWRVLLVCWAVLALIPAAPSFQDGVLSNLSPIGFGYLSLALAPTRMPPIALLVLGLHVTASFACMLAVCGLRRWLGSERFMLVAVVGSGLAVGAVVAVVHTCWPDGIFFDASNIYYDVSDLVRSPSRSDAHFADAAAIASRVRERNAGCRKHYMPCAIIPFSDEPTIVAWGTWPEQYHFRRELEALRRE